MQDQDLSQLLGLEKRYYAKLSETMTITQELAEAVSRQDSVSIEMLLSSRQKPLLELQEIQSHIALKRVDLANQEAVRFDHLVAGGEAQTPQEQPVAEQVSINRRLWERLVALDQMVSKNLCGHDSIYNAPPAP